MPASQKDSDTDFKKIEAFEEKLNNGKRTGLLGSIILKDMYIFRHTGNSKKQGRAYISSYIKINNKDYIVLFLISPETFENLKDDLEISIIKLLYDFQKRIDGKFF